MKIECEVENPPSRVSMRMKRLVTQFLWQSAARRAGNDYGRLPTSSNLAEYRDAIFFAPANEETATAGTTSAMRHSG